MLSSLESILMTCSEHDQLQLWNGASALADTLDLSRNRVGHHTQDPRIHVNSTGSWQCRFADLDIDDLHYKNRKYTAWGAYGQSKMGNLLWAKELSKRWAACNVVPLPRLQRHYYHHHFVFLAGITHAKPSMSGLCRTVSLDCRVVCCTPESGVLMQWSLNLSCQKDHDVFVHRKSVFFSEPHFRMHQAKVTTKFFSGMHRRTLCADWRAQRLKSSVCTLVL